MNTTTRPIRANQTSLGERAVYTIRVTPEERRDMQSEAWREAARFYLREQADLLRVIRASDGETNGR
jgi:hypothetical protein